MKDKSQAPTEEQDLQYYEYWESWHDMKQLEKEMHINQDGEENA